MKTVGTSEIAAKIRRPGEDETSAVNRLKSWVREGLFHALLRDTEPGTGRARQYAKEALVDAFLIEVLTQTLKAPAKSFEPHLKFLRYGLNSKSAADFLFVGMSPDKNTITPRACSTFELAEAISRSGQEVFVVLDVKALQKRFDSKE